MKWDSSCLTDSTAGFSKIQQDSLPVQYTLASPLCCWCLGMASAGCCCCWCLGMASASCCCCWCLGMASAGCCCCWCLTIGPSQYHAPPGFSMLGTCNSARTHGAQQLLPHRPRKSAGAQGNWQPYYFANAFLNLSGNSKPKSAADQLGRNRCPSQTRARARGNVEEALYS